MIKKLALVILLIGGLVAGTIPALAQNFPNNIGGRYMVSEYGKWSMQTLGPLTANVATTVNLTDCFVNVGTGNRKVWPFAQKGQAALNVPIQIQDGSNSETVTSESAATYPTTVTVPPTVQQYTCSITITAANSHNAGVTIVSGDGGLAEAINDAISQGAKVVTIDPYAAISQATIKAAVVYPQITIEDLQAGDPPYWTAEPTSDTFIATPTTLTSSTVTQNTSPAGSSSWGGTVYVCVAYVDIMGNEGACSATYHYTSTASDSVTITAPAASAGAVGYTLYLSLSGGTYAFAYQIPITSSVCTLTLVETVTPACAVTNTAYGQTGSNATFTGYPVNTAPIALQLGGASTTSDYVGNSNAHTAYAYAPAYKAPIPGVVTVSLPFTAGPSTVATTVPQIIGTVALPPSGFLNSVGQGLRVCGKATLTENASGTLEELQFLWDAPGSNAAGVPVILGTLAATVTGTAAAYNEPFCVDLITTVSSSSATGASILPTDGLFLNTLAAGSAAGVAGIDTNTGTATGSLNLAGTAGYTTRLHVVQLHSGGTDVSPQLLTLTVTPLS
jgi:hypothetical protein